jgi:endo-1,4-beta-xylanase
MIYELNKGGLRSFALAVSTALEGPWKRVTDKYATGNQLKTADGVAAWTEMVSHGELLRSGHNERMEYDPGNCRWLVQGILKKDSNVPYPSLPWKLGIMREVDSGGGRLQPE